MMAMQTMTSAQCKPATLTPGERLVRAFTGEPIDRLPFGVGLGWQPWGETLERWRRETDKPNLNPAYELAFDPGFVQPKLHYGMFPGFPHQVISEDAEFTVFRDWRGITQRQRRDHGSMPEFLEHPVQTPAAWQKLKRERLQSDPARVAQDWPAFHARLTSRGEAVQVGDFPWGIFGTARDLIGAERLLTWFHDEPDTVHDMMDHLTGLWLGLIDAVAVAVRIDHVHIWEDMAGKAGPLISPRMVERFMMPCYDRIAERCRAHGVRVLSVDSDGDVRLLAPIFAAHGANMMFPFEVQAGSDAEAYRRQLPGLAIWGGLDKRALAAGRSAIDREVERAKRLAATGRYVPMWDHLIPPDVAWTDFVYAAERLRRVCEGRA